MDMGESPPSQVPSSALNSRNHKSHKSSASTSTKITTKKANPTTSWSALPSPNSKKKSRKAKATAAQAPPFLLRLPVELHKDIIDLLKATSLPTLVNLRLANRYFYHLIPAPNHRDLLEIEHSYWARSRSLSSCKYCVRLRHRAKFADDMFQERRARGRRVPFKKFCVDCGFGGAIRKGENGHGAGYGYRRDRYTLGTEIIVNGRRMVWCKSCLEVEEGEDAKGCVGCCTGCHKTGGCGCDGYPGGF